MFKLPLQIVRARPLAGDRALALRGDGDSHEPHASPSCTSSSSVGCCVNPDERRNALWITMALIGGDHPAMPGTGHPIDRLTRQRQIFKGQNPAGLL
jgi:hypothetical protein